MPDGLGRNIAAAAGYLARFQRRAVGHFIHGAEDDWTGEVFETRSPIDHSVLAQVALGGVGDVDRATASAAKAFGPWNDLGGEARRRILHRVADAIESHADEIACIEAVDAGQPIRYMRTAAMRGAENFRFFADLAPAAADGLSMPTARHLNYTSRRAIGPVGVITPWNTPFMLSTWKIAPALAAGCTVVHKPAEWSPLSAALLAAIAFEAGLPPGVLNVVHGMGDDAGRAITEHAAIRAIAFVGETTTGSRIMSQGAATLKRVHFELGGKNPIIVFADADMDRAVDAALFMIYSLNGQRCTSSSRILLESSVHDAFTQRLVERIHRIRVGHPLDPATEIGPLIHPRHREKVLSYTRIALAEGATVAAGGAPAMEGRGNYVEPTLFTGATREMRIAREEIFGPVLTAIPFADEAEALSIANDVEYGLTGYVWTRDVARAHRVARALDVGMVWINSENVRHLRTPFGGVKNSGIGRDGGDWSFDFYMETKNIAVALGDHAIQKVGG